MATPPQVLRIKRKRGQDPLQALILEDSQRHKRSKPSSPVSSKPLSPNPEMQSWIFRLAGTDDETKLSNADVLASVLAEAASVKEQRQFVIPKSQTEEDTMIPHELSDMLDSFLHVNESSAPKRKRRGGKSVETVQNEELNELNGSEENDDTDSAMDDYVFDVYRLSETAPLTTSNYPSSQIGYIRFFDDDEYELLQSDGENKSCTQIDSDDEDSNAESFYQNDYPDDEDAGTYSDTYEASFDENNEDYGENEAYDEYDGDSNVGPVIIDSAEDAEGHAYLQGHIQADLAADRQFDNLYNEFFDEDGEQRLDFLQQDDSYSEEPFQRQNFFEGENDDEMAIYRDRIFGRLQRMINEH